MKFIAKKIDHSVNVSKEYQHPFKILVSFLFYLLIIFLCIYLLLTSIVEIAILSIPEKLNSVIGNKIHENITSPEKFLSNRDQAQQILDHLVSITPQLTGEKFHLNILETPEKNAYALPGNIIAITNPLLNELANENELTMILAHELGHFITNDHLRALSQQVILSGLITIVGIGSNSNDLSYFLAGSTGLLNLHYSKSQETSADNFGLHLLNKYYGHATGAISALQKIEDKNNEEKFWFKMITTHPLTKTRIELLKNIIQTEHMRLSNPKPLLLTQPNSINNAE